MKTYSKLVITTILFLTYSISSFAFDDLKDLLDNSKTTWAAEVYTDYALNESHFAIGRKKMKAKYGISTNTFAALKIQQPINDLIHLSPMTLASQVLEMKPNSSAKFFKDAALKEPLSDADYQKITQGKTFDTTFISQPDGSSKVGHIMTRKIHFNQISLFRVKQVLHYNEKTNELGLTAIAVAPLFCSYNKEGELTGTSPLFWIPIKDFNQEIDFNAPSINWAKRMTRSIDTDEMKVLKGKETLAEILNKVLNNYTQKPNSAILRHTSGAMPPMNSNDIKKLTSGIDTLITFDPVTFEETITEVDVLITPETMHKMRIVQDWVWNKETQSLSIQLVAFAPILKRYDNKNNFLFSGPLFYKKSNE